MMTQIKNASKFSYFSKFCDMQKNPDYTVSCTREFSFTWYLKKTVDAYCIIISLSNINNKFVQFRSHTSFCVIPGTTVPFTFGHPQGF